MLHAVALGFVSPVEVMVPPMALASCVLTSITAELLAAEIWHRVGRRENRDAPVGGKAWQPDFLTDSVAPLAAARERACWCASPRSQQPSAAGAEGLDEHPGIRSNPFGQLRVPAMMREKDDLGLRCQIRQHLEAGSRPIVVEAH